MNTRIRKIRVTLFRIASIMSIPVITSIYVLIFASSSHADLGMGSPITLGLIVACAPCIGLILVSFSVLPDRLGKILLVVTRSIFYITSPFVVVVCLIVLYLTTSSPHADSRITLPLCGIVVFTIYITVELSFWERIRVDP